MLPPRVPRLLAVLCLTVALALLCCEKTRAQSSCGSTPLCKPYDRQGPACTRKRRMDLRFFLDTSRENNFTVGGQTYHTATYGFCPVVDQLSSFTLTGAPFLTSSYITTNETSGEVTDHLSLNMGPRYLSVYGFGASNSTTNPERDISTGTVLIAVNGSRTTGVTNSVGIVTILSLEIGLQNGLFNYIDAAVASETTAKDSNNNSLLCTSNSTELSDSINCVKNAPVPAAEPMRLPAKVGFVPTCNAQDVCVMGDPSVYTCIGNVLGKKNCGVYKSNPTEIRDVQMTVLVSYYGTDSRRNVLTSGGQNPLNFATFVRENAFQAFAHKVTSFFEVNLSDVVGV
ncbi:conserved hypothetical protein [Leishmania braziliensis MHOM/BR/75/M2904]|uniref:Uncharacterized protein n=2 Tax=Leishmania braziliensis TaxID=5660 RepID=A4HIM8_LEIBR|nr:conserved hypothetical protein [Leishmania braziliensis MHOM/BR/75/M2904]CAJ2477369.1 unnamed protein product [Leishmania braziliensis]CAM40441.1 conserved hypothetical protein [Leishmania braziliensis MHOM/BR/75/M2904]